MIDSWPILEWIQQHEPSTSVMDELLELTFRSQATLLMSGVNYGEVLYSCLRKWPSDQAAQVLADIEALPIDIIYPDAELTLAAARLKAIVSASYADCFGAALALKEDVPVVTGDLEFRKLESHANLKLFWVGQ